MEITHKQMRSGDGLLRTAIAVAIAGSFSQGVAIAQESADGDKGDMIVVTGSRIQTEDTILPVTVIDRQTLELSGYSSAADFLRQLPFNSFGSFRPQSGSSAQGDAEISLRGLGSDRTLVLVNGRRLPKSPQTGAAQNLNVIPLGAIERIEILSDGASAVYGSDAIGGVINVILRKDFSGVEVMWGAGTPSIPNEGGDTREGSVTIGTSNDTTSILAVASWNTRDIVFARDFPWVVPGASIYSNNYAGPDTPFGSNFNVLPGACDENTGQRPDTFFTLPVPAAATYTGTRCGYDFTKVSADEASTDTSSIFVRGEHQIAADWSVYADMWYSKAESFGRYAPVPDATYFYDLLIDGDSPNNPTNPNSVLYDPAGAAVLGNNSPVHIYHRFDALGNRDNTVTTQLTDFNGGLNGKIGEVAVNAGYRYTENRSVDIGRNYLLGSVAWRLINEGAYNLAAPTETDEDVLNSINVTISRVSIYDQREAYASANWGMFELPGGEVQWAVGGEYREEDYDDKYDSLSESGSVGGSSGNSAGLDRTARAFFMETLLPILDNVEVSLAGRYDKYSDYGSDFSPKIAASYQPLSGLTLRTSYGHGFRAPTLDILSQKDSFSADSVRDPQTCINQGEPENCQLQINGLRTANPNLESESSKQFSIGVAFDLMDWLSGTLDYWDTKIEDRINFFDAQELVDLERAGDPVPDGLGVERAANGTITRIVQGYGNQGELNTSGVDLSLTARIVPGLTNRLAVSYTRDFAFDGGRDEVGDPGQPEYRAVLANTYNIGDFGFAWNMNVIDKTADTVTDGVREGKVPTWITHDVQASYNTPWNGRITVGALNVFEKFPPLGVGDLGQRDYDFNLYNGMGRITYVRLTQSF